LRPSHTTSTLFCAFRSDCLVADRINGPYGGSSTTTRSHSASASATGWAPQPVVSPGFPRCLVRFYALDTALIL